jgi:hypothetical protein
MAFIQCCKSSPFKASIKEWGSLTSTKKKLKYSPIFQPLLDFFTHVEEFFHLSSLVFDLEPYVLIILKPMFPH